MKSALAAEGVSEQMQYHSYGLPCWYCNIKGHFQSKNCTRKKYMENNALFKGTRLGKLFHQKQLI